MKADGLFGFLLVDELAGAIAAWREMEMRARHVRDTKSNLPFLSHRTLGWILEPVDALDDAAGLKAVLGEESCVGSEGVDERQLKEEALSLCLVLSREKHREITKRDEYGFLVGDVEHIARLDRLWRIASDRWRRRAGYDDM